MGQGPRTGFLEACRWLALPRTEAAQEPRQQAGCSWGGGGAKETPRAGSGGEGGKNRKGGSRTASGIRSHPCVGGQGENNPENLAPSEEEAAGMAAPSES